MDYRQIVVDSIIDYLEQLKTSNRFGVQFKTIGVTKQSPDNIKVLQEADMLPAMFYGYGDTIDFSDDLANNEVGKRIIYAIHIYFTKDAGDQYLINTVAKFEDAFATIVEVDMRDGINNDIEALGRSDDLQVERTNVTRTTALTLGFADVEARQIMFAVDVVYTP